MAAVMRVRETGAFARSRVFEVFDRRARTVAALVRLAMIRLMLKRLTRPNLCS
jgi:hypothetical protein